MLKRAALVVALAGARATDRTDRPIAISVDNFLQSFKKVLPDATKEETLKDEGVESLEQLRACTPKPGKVVSPCTPSLALHATASGPVLRRRGLPVRHMNAVFLLPEADKNDAFDLDKEFERYLTFRGHYYNVWVFRVNSIDQAQQVLERLGPDSIDHLTIDGHGSDTSLRLGYKVEKRKLEVNDEPSIDFFNWLKGRLAPRATIMLDSCKAGGWTVKQGVVLKESLLTFAAPYLCDHEVTGSTEEFGGRERKDYFDKEGRWTGAVYDANGENGLRDSKTSRTFVSCALTTMDQGTRYMTDEGAEVYNGAFTAYRGEWCPSYYEQRQKAWVAGNHGMVDRCARACSDDPRCKAFTYVQRSAMNRDETVAIRNALRATNEDAEEGSMPQEAQCYLSDDCEEMAANARALAGLDDKADALKGENYPAKVKEAKSALEKGKKEIEILDEKMAADVRPDAAKMAKLKLEIIDYTQEIASYEAKLEEAVEDLKEVQEEIDDLDEKEAGYAGALAKLEKEEVDVKEEIRNFQADLKKAKTYLKDVKGEIKDLDQKTDDHARARTKLEKEQVALEEKIRNFQAKVKEAKDVAVRIDRLEKKREATFRKEWVGRIFTSFVKTAKGAKAKAEAKALFASMEKMDVEAERVAARMKRKAKEDRALLPGEA